MERLETWIKYEAELLERLFVRKGTAPPASLLDLPSDRPGGAKDVALPRKKSRRPKGVPAIF